MIKLYNTLGRKLTTLEPVTEGFVKIYTCGPTVYDYQHVGNYSGYIYWDILVRLLKRKQVKVRRIINITDVGHLVSDSDDGEDKLEKGAKREGKSAREVADFYTTDFLKNFEKLNLSLPDKFAKATDYIPQQLEIIQRLFDKGFAYQTSQAIYFDVHKLSDYGKLSTQKLDDKEVGARSDVVTDPEKKHPQDFALWFFTVGRFSEHEMRWDSPWGYGFPGWHLECSAIIHAELGEPIDIHAGGVDHIGTHHTNEIAQSEVAFENELAKIWIHNNHMLVDDQKISKSLGNGYTIKDLESKGYNTDDFKMLVLQSHYRTQSKFSWALLEAAKANLASLNAWSDLIHQNVEELSAEDAQALSKDIFNALEDDLNTPKALAAINTADLTKKPIPQLLEFIDSMLGFSLSDRPDITTEQKNLIETRLLARSESNWPISDKIRDQLLEQGIALNDAKLQTIWQRLE